MNIQVLVMEIAYIIVIIGALNWGLVGLFGMDLVARIFGAGSMMARVIYVVIGVAAVLLIAALLFHM